MKHNHAAQFAFLCFVWLWRLTTIYLLDSFGLFFIFKKLQKHEVRRKEPLFYFIFLFFQIDMGPHTIYPAYCYLRSVKSPGTKLKCVSIFSCACRPSGWWRVQCVWVCCLLLDDWHTEEVGQHGFSVRDASHWAKAANFLLDLTEGLRKRDKTKCI